VFYCLVDVFYVRVGTLSVRRGPSKLSNHVFWLAIPSPVDVFDVHVGTFVCEGGHLNCPTMYFGWPYPLRRFKAGTFVFSHYLKKSTVVDTRTAEV
jgi:hypothetical protein